MVHYYYDAWGRRISKGDITFTYDCEGNLIKQSNGLEFFYDSQGIAGFVYGGNNYFYKKDIQGNILEIINANGDMEACYKYDAWGNHIVSGNSTIANLNPFRYRGYYYDTEFGLYYLQTRYYDPQTCRFLNMDSIDYADPSAIGGLNLYAYCNNDPVNYVDPSGCMPNWLKWVIGGIAFVGAIALTAMTGGALSPLVFTMSAGILVSGLIEGGVSAVNGGSFEQGFLDGAADGALWGGIFALAGSFIRLCKILSNGVVVGESMSRVGAAAKQIGAATYQAPGKPIVQLLGGKNATKIMLNQNQRWIGRMIKWGVKIYDIGIDVARPVAFRSIFYAMEADTIKGYWNVLRMLFP